MNAYSICLNDSCKNNLILQKDNQTIQNCIDSSHRLIKSQDLIENAQCSIKVFSQALDLLKESYIFNEQPGLSNINVQNISAKIKQELEQSIKYSHESINCIQNGFISQQFLKQLLYIDMEGNITNIQFERIKALTSLLQQINSRKCSINQFNCQDLIQEVDQKHIQILSIDIQVPIISFINRITVYALLPSIQTLYLSIMHQQLTEQENNTLCHFIAIQTSLKRLRLQIMIGLQYYNHLKNIIQSLVINRSIKYLTLDQSCGVLPLQIFVHLAHLIKYNQNIKELKLLFDFTKFQVPHTDLQSLIAIFLELEKSKSINYFYGYFNSLKPYSTTHLGDQIVQLLAKNKVIQEFCLETTSIKYNLNKISQGLRLNEGLQYFNLTSNDDYEIDDVVTLCKAAEDRMLNSTLRYFNSYSYVIPYEYKSKFKILTEYQNFRYQALFYILAYKKHFAPYIIYNPYIQYIDLFVN
ncbi:hypothetical protein TTHERM_00287980 (macronuclear) [Tetrahymena thermophila SB210]|uniref:Uncharacterized protein n=1 Tax=Tetrahymena thermophila (strain SB210) TaxID=312017 RepID=I7LVJ8_TETTS|nr:hypothetical protein TTHERM_00287980 [Tetrahymena thermophila SB210]EAR98369.2 hypothetical protein TTHERM_00287980 [Tetrahymena thermophila SB210]|eukprot:XP_001018614.2 hypothetical protein TTHERM_00287980 [Tetrahymena thermophila SB210]